MSVAEIDIDKKMSILKWEAPSSDKIFPHFSHGCPEKKDHEIGSFCEQCRGIGMPWGAELPVYYESTENNRALLHGPPGSLASHVLLSNEEAIAVLSVVASMDVRGRLYREVDGLPKLMRRYPESVYAGQDIADFHRSFLRVTGPEHELLEAHDIVEAALKDPHLTWESFGDQVHARMRSIAPVIHYGLSAEEIAAELIYEKRNIPKSKNSKGKWNAPPKGNDKSKWEFCPGSDTSLMIVGKPEPQKLFLVRQKRNNPNIKDCRQYPGWETFDWNDPDTVEAMNKSRRQILHRTVGGALPKAPVWTQAEKDVLKDLIKAALDSGIARKDIQWETIAEDLFKHFGGQVQRKGSPLAQNQQLNKDGTISPPRRKFPKKLTEDREGCSKRKGQTVKTQAQKYGDIALMIRMSTPQDQQSDSESEVDDSGDSEDEQHGGKGVAAASDLAKPTTKAAEQTTNKKDKNKGGSKFVKKEGSGDDSDTETPEPSFLASRKRARLPGRGAGGFLDPATPRYSKLLRVD